MDRSAVKSPVSDSSSTAGSTSLAVNASGLAGKHIATKDVASVSESPTWFLTSFDARKDGEETERSGSERADEYPSFGRESTTLSGFRGSLSVLSFQELEGLGGVYGNSEGSGKLIRALACVLTVFAATLAVKLGLPKEKREYFITHSWLHGYYNGANIRSRMALVGGHG